MSDAPGLGFDPEMILADAAAAGDAGREVLAVLLDATDSTTAAIWLTTPSGRLGDLSALAWLSEGRDPGRVLAAAREDASRWKV